MKFLMILVLSTAAVFTGCESSSVSNSNSNRDNSANAPANGNSNGGWTKIEPTNGANSAGTNTTPTPGIPDPANFNKPFKPGTTPTPGIPDAANIRKQMQRNADAANTANAVNAAMNPNGRVPQPTMKNSKKRPGTVANKIQ